MQVFYEDIQSQFGNVYVPISCHAVHTDGEPYISNPHWHNYIEIVYTVSGESAVNIGSIVDRIGAGDIVIINSKETHSFKSLEGKRLYQIVLKFDPNILHIAGDSAVEYKYIYPLLLLNDYKRIFTKDTVKQTEIPQVMSKLLDEFNEKPYAFEISLHMYTLRVFLWFLYEWKKENFLIYDTHRLNIIRKFNEVFTYVSKNLDKKISTERAAKMCNMSYGYFCRSFKETTGNTFSEYLNHMKISRAQQLLVTTDLNITQISEQVGFTSVNYFIRKFRETAKIKPMKFRKSYM
ncbi:MAG: AraC family transcriptional regulator [Eubacteriales bacterium]